MSSKYLDAMYKEIDDLLIDGKYAAVDEILRQVHVDAQSLTMLLGYLTITFMFKDSLSERQPLLEKIRHKAEVEAPARAERLLAGL